MRSSNNLRRMPFRPAETGVQASGANPAERLYADPSLIKT